MLAALEVNLLGSETTLDGDQFRVELLNVQIYFSAMNVFSNELYNFFVCFFPNEIIMNPHALSQYGKPHFSLDSQINRVTSSTVVFL